MKTNSPAPASLEQRFRELVKQVRRDTAHLSMIEQKVEHPSYREIVGMGWPVVPLLLAELRRRPGFWFVALLEITGVDPVPPDSEGDIAAIARAWIEWGRAQGHIE